MRGRRQMAGPMSRLAIIVLPGLILSAFGVSVAGAAGDEALAQLGLAPAVVRAGAGIDGEHIREHVKFLADDLLEGRGTGTRGGDIAAHYIAAQFALAGLKPAGDGGGYLQRVDFTGVHTLPVTTASIVGAHGEATDLRLGEDFVVSNQTQLAQSDVDAPIVFVGYGIEAPEYQWDDFKGVDVRGKVVLVIVNEPPSKDPKFFNGEALTYYGRWSYKYEQAARKGAVGALIIHRTDLASYGWNVVRSSWSNEQVYLGGDRDPKLVAAAWIQEAVAQKLLASAGLDLRSMIDLAGTRRFKARELPVRFRAHIVSEVRQFASYNVLGILPGAEATPTRAVVYTAHYDHLGIDPAMTGDNIYNGAVDNATGCGVVMELARAFGASTVPPPEPILFAAVTAEEKGLLGSNYLGKHLPLRPSQVALDLNFDAIPPIGTPQSVNVTGAERTDFYPVVQRTAAAFGLEIEPDPAPGAGHFYRSDHFSFARMGIPAFSVNTALKFAGHEPAWGKAQEDDYVEHRYHQPSDEYRPEMDFASNVVLARFGFALGWQAAAATHTIEWLPGDEFEARRHTSEVP